MGIYRVIPLFLDNVIISKKAIQNLIGPFEYYNDISKLYIGFKEINELLIVIVTEIEELVQ